MPHTPRKSLRITTEVDIHAVSCPGVWIPGKGRSSLSVCLLGFHTRTNKLPPVFPLLYHEKFKFERTFVGVTNLSVLERVLEAESVYLELVQEELSGETVLAVFESSVRDLLFPKPAEKLSYSGVDLDLLMEPTRDFPGIISPKIEVSTRTNVSETRTPLHQCAQDTVSFGHAGNKIPKAVFRPNSDETTSPTADKEAKCQDGCSNNPGSPSTDRKVDREGPRPQFTYRRPEEDLLSRIPRSTSKNNRYLGIGSRYLSRSAGNLTDLPRTAISSRYGMGGFDHSSHPLTADGLSLTHPRRRDADCVDAEISLLQPERCPHCDGAHGPETCTTCRTYHRYFPRPANPRLHAHAHAYHARAHDSGLKVLQQPARDHLRRRKRYLADIEDEVNIDPPLRRARSLSPMRRPTSAPPIRAATIDHEPCDDGDPAGSGSESGSRSPSPTSAGFGEMAKTRPHSSKPHQYRRYLLDSDDDSVNDLIVPKSKYRPLSCCVDYGYGCTVCDTNYGYGYYTRLARYYQKKSQDALRRVDRRSDPF